MISKKKILGLINSRITDLDNGLFLVSLTTTPSNDIRVEIDKHEGGVSVMDCASVSRNVEHNLDREKEDFNITVSSAGLDKGLRVFPQYKKNIGREVKVKLKEGKKIRGKMILATPLEIKIQSTEKKRIEGKKKKETVIEEHILKMEDIHETKVVVSFK